MEHYDRPGCIVLPFQSTKNPGIGLALHFLLGNVVAVHPEFRECWFGWRAAKIFLRPGNLMRYCRGLAPEPDLQRISAIQHVQYWVRGRIGPDSASLFFLDARTGSPTLEKCSFELRDHLVGFRQCFLRLLDRCGCPMDHERQPMALWPEFLSRDGLRLVGLALEAFYLHSFHAAQTGIELAPFEAAVEVAPESFMAHDLLGWAYYRKRISPHAKASFLRALELNPHAVGPMAGLTACAVLEKDREAALDWAARKARARAQDAAAALEKVREKFQS